MATSIRACRYSCNLWSNSKVLIGSIRVKKAEIGLIDLVKKRWMCYEARKIDITSSKQAYLFDTHSLVKKLENSGFSVSQAEAVSDSLVQILNTLTENQQKNLVTKSQQEIMVQQIMSQIAAVKKDMVILEKSEFSALRAEYEKQRIEVHQLRQQLEDEIAKVRGGITLDLNLERGRVTDINRQNEKILSDLEHKISIQLSSVEKNMARIDNKIDREMANLLATYERYRNDILKYSGGAVMTCLTICLGFYRLWS